MALVWPIRIPVITTSYNLISYLNSLGRPSFGFCRCNSLPWIDMSELICANSRCWWSPDISCPSIVWFDTVIVSCLVSSVHFSCIIHYCLYHNMDIDTMWHCALVSNTESQSIGLFFGVCVVLMLSVIRCSCYYFVDRILFHHDLHLDSCDYHWSFMAIHYFLKNTLDFL